MRGAKKRKTEVNPSAYNKLRRTLLKCPICPPNAGENSKRKARHGSKKPKYKNKR